VKVRLKVNKNKSAPKAKEQAKAKAKKVKGQKSKVKSLRTQVSGQLSTHLQYRKLSGQIFNLSDSQIFKFSNLQILKSSTAPKNSKLRTRNSKPLPLRVYHLRQNILQTNDVCLLFQYRLGFITGRYFVNKSNKIRISRHIPVAAFHHYFLFHNDTISLNMNI